MSRPSKNTVLLAGAIIVVVVCGIALLATATRSWARDLEATARAGKAHAEAGARGLASRDATTAADEFAKASREFERANDLLGPAWVARAANTVPPVGRQYAAAELAAALGQAPSGDATKSRETSVLATGQTHILKALARLASAAERSSRLDEDGLVAPLAKQVRSLKAVLGRNAPLLQRSRALSSLASELLPTEHRILLVSQNSAELRPTGGFIGSYGILTIGPKGVKLDSYKDVYELPNPPGRVPMPPGALMTKRMDFQFRDANWWIDFPTSARRMLGFWSDMGQPPVDGIIAIDVVAMQDILGVLGPIKVPDFAETFTADNLVKRLTYLIEVKSGGGSGKKDVLIALADELEKRVLDAGAHDATKLLLAAAKAADAKHVQMYFVDPAAQAAVTELGWAGSVDAPARTTDLVAVSNAMTRPGKVNFAMRKRATYDVALQPDGSAETTLVLDYANTGRLAVSERGVFRNYLRVYRAPGTIAAKGDRTTEDATGTPDVDLPKVIREFSVGLGRKHAETISGTVPGAWRPAGARGGGRAGDGLARYRLFVVRQADLEEVPTSVRVAAPPGWRVAAVRAWKTASRERVPAESDGETARVAVPLAGDMVLDVDLARE